MSGSLNVAGWYGKLPGLGDFASRRLPSAFVQAWDAWLQQGLSAARDEWGDAWLDHYLVAPILRFWLDVGVLDGVAWMGLVMPSVDRVNRYFPLTVAQPAAGTLAQTLNITTWFDATDAAMRKVLDTAFTVDDFERELHALPPALCHHEAEQGAGRGDAPARRTSAWWQDGAIETPHVFDGLPPPRAFTALWANTP